MSDHPGISPQIVPKRRTRERARARGAEVELWMESCVTGVWALPRGERPQAVCPAMSGASSVLECAMLVVFDAAGNAEHVQQGLLQRRPRQDQVHVVGP